MEKNLRLNEDEISSVLRAIPEDQDKAFDVVELIQKGVISREVVPQVEADRELAIVISLGSIAEKGADVSLPLAA